MAIGTAAAVLGGASILGGVASSVIGGKSAKSAASTQAAASDAAIAEQRRQFDEVRDLLKPFIETGESALAKQAALAGLVPGGFVPAVRQIQEGPEYQTLLQQGEDAILANASATGGLRTGTTQGALAQFRPALLADLINQQYTRLGGLSGMGQASAAGQAAAGQQTASNVGSLLENRGAAVAGGQLAQGQMYQNVLGTLGQGAGFFGRMAGVF